jgi:molybdopterin-guanine dinucleotide biosynthesis protein B
MPAKEPILDEQLQYFDQSELDLLLVEGFKAEKFPKIELHRPSLEKPILYPNDPNIIAIASDCPLPIPDYLTQLDINQPQMIADFILNHFKSLV